MWGSNDYETSGGFSSTQGGDAGTPGGDKKRARAQNLVPVHIKEILEASEEGMTIDARPVGMVEFVGQVTTVDVQASKTTYTVDDGSGSINAVHWTDGEKAVASDDPIEEGTQIRVIGVIRSQKGEKHIMVFRVAPVTGGQPELDAHKLEVVYAKIKIRQLVDKENSAIGANPLSNSMVGGFGGSTGAGSSGVGSMGGGGGGGSTFGNPKHESVFKMLQGCERDEGLHRDEVLSGLKGRGLTKKDVDDALTYLSDEGHIYATMDEDHFKTTDD